MTTKKQCKKKTKMQEDEESAYDFSSLQRKPSLLVQEQAQGYYEKRNWAQDSSEDSNSSYNEITQNMNSSFQGEEDEDEEKLPQKKEEEKKKKKLNILRQSVTNVEYKRSSSMMNNELDQEYEKQQEISRRRTRQRSYDKDKQSNNSDDKELYFSISTTDPLSKKIYSKRRDPKDIQNDSIQTSYHIKHSSFKWSTLLKYPSLTYQKGINLNEISKNQANKLNKDGNIIQEEQHESKSSTQYKPYLQKNPKENIVEELSSYKSLSNYAMIFSQYIELQKKHQQNQHSKQKPIINLQQQCLYLQKLDRGSFGQVDLYLFQLEDTLFNNNDTPITTKQIEQPINQSVISSQYSQQSNSTQFDSQRLFQFMSSNSSATSNISAYTLSESKEITLQSTHSNTMHEESVTNVQQITSSNEYAQHTLAANQQLSTNQTTQQQLSCSKNKYLPVAGKKIHVQKEFIRELFIMQTINCDFMPKLLTQDVDEQILFIELGLCSLYDLKLDSLSKKYRFSDEFTYSILINLIHAIESLLQNYNEKDQKHQALFHSDIKPQNIILTVRKDKETNQDSIKLLLIDFGGASFELEDYWSYYTPAFVCSHLWDKLANAKNNWGILSWPQIRYAEVYAACRSVQFLMIDSLNSSLFKKQNSKEFIEQFQTEYPNTCRILESIFINLQDYRIFSDYRNVLSPQEISSQSKQITPLDINFDQQQLYQISKLYKIVHESP